MKKLIGHISEELLGSIPNIKHHYIESEHPDHHWNFLEVKDQIVLDLGCGFHLIESGWETTPAYFINKGANKLIGVDTEYYDIETLKATYPEHEFYCEIIDTVEKLNYYINDKGVTSLKMDIEGEEVKFIDSLSNYPTLKYVAIESHSKEILNNLIKKLISLGFTIDIVCTFYPRVYEICNLVYASRK
jgi:uncharacterized protein (UPF0128 family)